MAYTADILDSLVPITQFNRGQASRIFDRLHTENQLIVLKNNQPAAIILSPSEFQRLSEIEEDYTLLLEATRRLKEDSSSTSSREELMSELNISEVDYCCRGYGDGMRWQIEYLEEAKKDLKKLDRSAQIIVLKGIDKVSENPLPAQQGGYGKPLGNKSGTNLTNLLKIKFRDIGIRVVYKVEYTDTVMKIIVISARADEQVYKEANKRKTRHDL
mgnify:CR=1 FL=1